MTHPNEELARSEMQAAQGGDFEALLAHLLSMRSLHNRPAESSDLPGLLTLRTAEYTLSALHYLQEADHLR